MKKLNLTEAVLRQEIIARKLATEEQLDGELSIPFMNGCHSKVNQYLSLVRSEDVENAYNKPARIEVGKAEVERSKAHKFWINPVADAKQVQECFEASETFIHQHPAFDSTLASNRQAMGAELARLGVIPNKPEILHQVFVNLTTQGRLELIIENDPRAPKDAPSSGVTGTQLQRWIREMPDLLNPVVHLTDSQLEQQRIANLSADSYAAEFLQQDELPPMIQRRIESDIREFCADHPNYDPLPEGKEILLSWIREQGLHVCHDSLEASWAANQEKLHAANCVFDEGPSIPVRYNATTFIDHRKPFIPPVQREVTLEPTPTIKRVDMEKLLALPADEFRRVVNGTPGLRELLDGERS